MLITIIDSIPEELALREHPITIIVGLGLFLSFFLIALAKLIKSDIYLSLILSLIKIKGLTNFLRESFQIQKGGSILLVVNYLVSFGLLLLLLFNLETIQFSNEMAAVLLIPIIMLAYHVVCFYTVGIIAGEVSMVQTPILIKINGAQLLGIGCSVLAFLWSLNFVNAHVFINATIILLIAENVLRIVRSFIYVLTIGVPWYYIIMYLCTLEILPLFVIYFLVVAA